MDIVERLESGISESRSRLMELMERARLPFDDGPGDIPAGPGVYVIYEGDEPVYVGKSKNLRRRVFSQLFNNKSHYFSYHMVEQRYHTVAGLQKYLESKCSVQWITTSEDEANWLERFVTGVIRPIYNGGSEAFGKPS